MVSIFAAGFFRKPAVQWAVVTIVALLAAYRTTHWWSAAGQTYVEDHALTMNVLSQIRELPKPAPNSRVLFLRDPFRDWDTYFIADLVWDDHTLDVKLADKLDRPPDLAQYDEVLDFEGQKLRVVRTR